MRTFWTTWDWTASAQSSPRLRPRVCMERTGGGKGGDCRLSPWASTSKGVPRASNRLNCYHTTNQFQFWPDYPTTTCHQTAYHDKQFHVCKGVLKNKYDSYKYANTIRSSDTSPVSLTRLLFSSVLHTAISSYSSSLIRIDNHICYNALLVYWLCRSRATHRLIC